MPGQIIPAGQFNPAALTASGAYVAVQTPPGYIQGVPTDVVGVVGTASWGPVNQPVHLGSGVDATVAFGPVASAALTDPYDLATDLQIAFTQAQSQASLEAWAVRVTDGTDVAATLNATGAATALSQQITIGGTISAGNTVELTVTSSAVTGSPVSVTYTCKAGDTTATVASGLAALLNANSALAAAGFYASAASNVTSLYFPSADTATVSDTVTPASGGPTATIAAGASTAAGATLQTLYTGIGGNSVSMVVSAGITTGSYTVTLFPPYGGVPEVYPNIAGTGFWKSLAQAINNGLSPSRPQSQIAKVTAYNSAVGTPTPGTYAFTGGTDGRTGVTTATLVGSDTAIPRTGMYALRAQNPGVSIVWLVGCTDNVALASLVSFGQSEACSTLWSFPEGTSSTTAETDLQTYGQNDTSLNVLKDWVYWFDANNKQTRQVPPSAFVGGMWATQAPQNSPDNKPIYGVQGTERNPPNTSGAVPYTLSEIGGLQQAGITIITNPINAGSIWGTWGGRSTSTGTSDKPSEYWRMTCYLARSLEAYMGKYIGQNQTQQPNDPLRRQVRLELNQFLQQLQGNAQIDAYQVICAFTTTGSAGNGYNTPASIAQHYLYALAKVTYMSSVWFFIMTLDGGTTVQVQATNQLPA